MPRPLSIIPNVLVLPHVRRGLLFLSRIHLENKEFDEADKAASDALGVAEKAVLAHAVDEAICQLGVVRKGMGDFVVAEVLFVHLQTLSSIPIQTPLPALSACAILFAVLSGPDSAIYVSTAHACSAFALPSGQGTLAHRRWQVPTPCTLNLSPASFFAGFVPNVHS